MGAHTCHSGNFLCGVVVAWQQQVKSLFSSFVDALGFHI